MRYLILVPTRHTCSYFDAPLGFATVRDAWAWLCAQPSKAKACQRVCYNLGVSAPFGIERVKQKPGPKKKFQDRNEAKRENRRLKRRVKQWGKEVVYRADNANKTQNRIVQNRV